jgi:hypothetical protein
MSDYPFDASSDFDELLHVVNCKYPSNYQITNGAFPSARWPHYTGQKVLSENAWAGLEKPESIPNDHVLGSQFLDFHHSVLFREGRFPTLPL